MPTAKVFSSGRSQAVRLPKEFRFKAREVGIARLGNLVLLFPLDKAWEIFEQGARSFTADFMAERDQPEQAEERPEL